MSLNKQLSSLLNQQFFPCPVARVCSELDAEEADMFTRLLGMNQISTRSLHHALRSEGVSISRDSITRHRRHMCVCYLEAK